MSKLTNISIKELLSSLSEEEQKELLLLPRSKRLDSLAKSLDQSEDILLRRLSSLFKMDILTDWELSKAPTETLPLRLLLEYQILPLAPRDESDNQLRIVTPWPPDHSMTEWIYATSGKKPIWYLGAPDKITSTITHKFGVGSDSLSETDIDSLEEEELTEEEDQNAAIIRFVNEIILKAITDRATDIHFEPQKDQLQIRYRIDGRLVPVSVPDNLVKFQSAIISRIKIMSRLNISERRRPQDGRINFEARGSEPLDIRISTLPTMYGESISMRLLAQSSSPLTIEDLGFLPNDIKFIDKVLERPHGIILVTGPTGSGKSTTLTTFIRKIHCPERRIITVEDPVEYEIKGVNQTQVHAEIGLTFANTLRTVLRQDPDVIMVGEIRDQETSDIAVRASLTGHLVLSTLHTNDAPGALTRLIDMDIEPFLIASSIEMIIAQRLVRRLCPHCASPSTIEPGHLKSCLKALGVNEAEVEHIGLVMEPKGCDKCRGLGYKGRVAIFEILKVTEDMHNLIVAKDASQLRKHAIEHGMQTLQQTGWEQVKRGLTTLTEIMPYAEITSGIEV